MPSIRILSDKTVKKFYTFAVRNNDGGGFFFYSMGEIKAEMKRRGFHVWSQR